MIDCHCHLEQEDYSKDRGKVIEKCRKELKAVITCCAHPDDFDLTMKLVENYKGFVFAVAGLHPVYIKEIKDREGFFELVKENKDKIVGIGETGLDFKIEENWLREKQKELFIKSIKLSKVLGLPLVIHGRQAFKETIDILEEYDAKNVLMHFFTARELLNRVVNNGWYVSVNTTLLTSKKIKKIVRDLSIDKILTETDSPWLDPHGKRNLPTNVKLVIEKIAVIKRMKFEDVNKITTENAIKFFNLS